MASNVRALGNVRRSLKVRNLLIACGALLVAIGAAAVLSDRPDHRAYARIPLQPPAAPTVGDFADRFAADGGGAPPQVIAPVAPPSADGVAQVARDPFALRPVDDATRACMDDMLCTKAIFLKMALGLSEREPRPVEQQRIMKWTKPVGLGTAGLDSLPPERVRRALRTVEGIIAISKAAGIDLDVRRPGADREINMLVFISDDFVRDRHQRFASLIESYLGRTHSSRYDMVAAELASRQLCAGRVYSDRTFAISRSFDLIPSTISAPDFEACLYEELVQNLGLTSDVDDVVDSMFTDRASQPSLTQLDFLLLRILYHPAIRPGMDENEVRSVFAHVYSDVTGTPRSPS
ncbi:DUF2927 domain-containing protein [Marinivivus vitaminiproducens]|uniref:DUF2927 domain-containing protein n=1 Tax=Marinivivus vitaminiproducens TaxID=3035935 RepID=UPI0027A845C7|nr:DUF2927 domain-containing protein [Geminicoccaceae bacterium SCSIO 64248]